MAKLQVNWTSKADTNKKLIFLYWNRRNKSNSYSIKLSNLIDSKITILQSFPEIGTKTNFPKIRFIRIKHYLLFYQISNNKIDIVNFIDGRRDPEEFMER